jgi:hypothetical protein
MKTEIIKQQPLCNGRKSLFGHCCSFLWQVPFHAARTLSSKILRLTGALPIYQDGLVAFLTRLKSAIREAWSNKRFRVGVINRQELIDKIIWSQYKGMRMDDTYYNDRYNALNKLSDEVLLKTLQ